MSQSHSTSHPIERAVELLAALILEDPELEREFVASRDAFFAAPLPAAREAQDRAESDADQLARARRTLAERRHLEWFAFERESPSLGDLPAHALLERWRERADAETEAHADALLHSRVGVFRIAQVEPGLGVWIEDLAGLGSLPIAEPEASHDLLVGDLLAGRVFPIGDAQFRLSPAVAVFRNPDLVDALQRDLARARESRRGTLRVAQREIERMFFAQTEEPAPPPAAEGTPAEDEPGAAERAERVLELLTADGAMDEDEVAGWLQAFAEAASAAGERGPAGQLISALLDRAAFETTVDLEALRGELHGLWRAHLAAAASTGTEPETASSADTPAAPPASAALRMFHDAARRAGARVADSNGQEGTTADVAGALEEFDAGRAEGKDLDQLFRDLERSLGIEDGGEESTEPTPDFPGIVGALVEEYLWELGFEDEAAASSRRPLLESLAGDFAHFGAIEQLETEHLVAALARDALHRGGIRDSASAQHALHATEHFARWIERNHDHPLWTLFKRTHAELVVSLPRIAELNAALCLPRKASEPSEAAGEPHVAELVLDPDSSRLGVLEDDGRFLALAGRAPAPREGDLVRYEVDEGGALRPLAYYPPELARILS